MCVGEDQAVAAQNHTRTPVISAHPVRIAGYGDNRTGASFVDLLQSEILPCTLSEREFKTKVFRLVRDTDIHFLILGGSVVLTEEITELLGKLLLLLALSPVPRSDDRPGSAHTWNDGIGKGGGQQGDNEDECDDACCLLPPQQSAVIL